MNNRLQTMIEIKSEHTKYLFSLKSVKISIYANCTSIFFLINFNYIMEINKTASFPLFDASQVFIV